MNPIERYLTPNARNAVRSAIEEAGGSEIFVVLRRSKSDDPFDQVTVVCRGSESEVPALLSRVRHGDMTLHNHPSGDLRPSNQDFHLATLFGEEGTGSMIVDNAVASCYVIAEPDVERALQPVRDEQIERVFCEDGLFSQVFPGFEVRQAQLDMARSVAESLRSGSVLTVEAGTGTGKSLAYLVPSLLFVKENRKRVVIATKTINLQEQLLFKDIPLAQKLVDNPPKAVLIKGRGHYVCLRKLRDLCDHQLALFSSEEDALKKEILDLAQWMEESGSGDRADLPFLPSREAWERVQSDADMCLGSKCPFFQQAPFYQSRRAAAKARILIVNQALLFSDLALRSISGNFKASAVIPPYDVVILDEAHSMESIATDHFATKVSSFAVKLGLGRFLSVKGGSGLLHRLRNFAKRQGLTEFLGYLEADYLVAYREFVELVLDRLDAFSKALHQAFNAEKRRKKEVWLQGALVASEIVGPAREKAAAFISAMQQLLVHLRALRRRVASMPHEVLDRLSGLVMEFDARLQRLESHVAMLKQFAGSVTENQVPWLSLKIFKNDRLDFEYKISPLDVSPVLRESLFSPFHSVIMTSATLDLDDGFSFFANRHGLSGFEEKPCVFETFPSPFDYATQAVLVVPPVPVSPGAPSFGTYLSRFIVQAAQSSPGGTLVLFTSYQLLYCVGDLLEAPLAAAGLDLLIQGRAQRSHLAQQLASGQGVLLGTDSFWEGIDLPGTALTKVIITKLPFPQLKDPLFEARSAAIEARGESAFQTFSLPLALLKFKQGAGRLIRARSDSGTLFVTDRRILDKSYGRRFLSLLDHFPLTTTWSIEGETW